jgi:hypothetical protein
VFFGKPISARRGVWGEAMKDSGNLIALQTTGGTFFAYIAQALKSLLTVG